MQGLWLPRGDELGGGGLGLLVLDGVLRRRTAVDGRTSCELLGAGDLLRPWQDEDDSASLPAHAEWTVRITAVVAVIDADVTARLAAWPPILVELADRSLRRSRSFAVRMAIAQVPSFERRVHLLFWHLADRWGSVGPEGVLLSIKPDQETIGNLIAASRTRVNAALRALKRDAARAQARRDPARATRRLAAV